MKTTLSPNRAITDGDRGWFKIGQDSQGMIRAKVGQWSTPFLTKFLKTCTSEPYRRAVTQEIQRRNSPKTKHQDTRQRKRSRHPA